LVPLENKLNQKLAKVSDNSPYNHVQIGGDRYLLIACYQTECLTETERQLPQYAILKILYDKEHLSIYLAKSYD
jgi:hypothetical protein